MGAELFKPLAAAHDETLAPYVVRGGICATTCKPHALILNVNKTVSKG